MLPLRHWKFSYSGINSSEVANWCDISPNSPLQVLLAMFRNEEVVLLITVMNIQISVMDVKSWNLLVNYKCLWYMDYKHDLEKNSFL